MVKQGRRQLGYVRSTVGLRSNIVHTNGEKIDQDPKWQSRRMLAACTPRKCRFGIY